LMGSGEAQMKICSKHGDVGRYKRGCKQCAKENAKKWREANPQRARLNKQRWLSNPKNTAKHNARGRRSRELLKLEVFGHYASGPPRCACCGEAEIAFLTIDHIGGEGAAERRILGRGKVSGTHFYRRLRRAGYPGGFQVLCYNCNSAKHWLGTCPHKRR